MEIGSHIREHRMESGLSQDDLAERIYVSRQTISNWETGRTYPDVQSLLLLSTLFGTTTDSLIKGDVETMAKVMDEAAKRYHRIATTAVVSGVVFLALAVWLAFQMEWGWGAQMAPSAVFAVAALVVMLVSMGYLSKLQKEHDLATYREILAFSRGEFVDRDTDRGRRERAMKPWVKGVRTSVYMLVGAACGGALGIGLAMLAKAVA